MIDDGPVGSLLRQAEYPLRRPAHLHLMVKALGFEMITTHIYDGSDQHLGEDTIFGVKPELIREFERVSIGGAPSWRLEFTFVMTRAKRGPKHEPKFRL